MTLTAKGERRGGGEQNRSEFEGPGFEIQNIKFWLALKMPGNTWRKEGKRII